MGSPIVIHTDLEPVINLSLSREAWARHGRKRNFKTLCFARTRIIVILDCDGKEVRLVRPCERGCHETETNESRLLPRSFREQAES